MEEILVYEELTSERLATDKNLVTGQSFVYKRTDTGLWQKGIMVNDWMMVPVGLQCKTIPEAKKQN